MKLANEELILKLSRPGGFDRSTVNAKGFKTLHPSVGAIYGDSINLFRAETILKTLAEMGYASDNVVLGIGSYTYQYTTRDTYGFAMKSTWAEIDGQGVDIYKDPVTDDGVKKSARGRLFVHMSNGRLQLLDGASVERSNSPDNLLQPVWKNGRFLRETNIKQIREILAGQLDPFESSLELVAK